MRFTTHARRYVAKQSVLRPRSTKSTHPDPPRLEAKIKNYAVFKDGYEQHDAEPGQHAQVLEDKMSQLAALVVLTVSVKHFWQLQERKDVWVQIKTSLN